jgi:basic amino acid/polyamine antiporter, APA family
MPGHAHPDAYGARDITKMKSETSVASSERNGTAGGEHGPELIRGLNLWHAISIVAGTIIGSGIFLVPAEMMQAVGSAALVYLAWIVGGLLSFFGALTYAELGAVRPYSGGEYVYVRDAYGPLWGFLYGWTWFLIAKPASIASVTAGLVRVLGTFSAFSFLPQTMLAWHVSSNRVLAINYGHLVAIAATVLITGINYIGVRKAGNFQFAFTVLKVVMIVGIAVIAFTASSGKWSNFGTSFVGAKGGMVGFMAALVAALWAYDGWNDLNMVSEEIQRPERTIPFALIAGVGLVAVLYMGMNAGIQRALPAAAIAQSAVPASAASEAALGRVGISLVSIGMIISMLATLNGTIMSGGRVPFAVARDGYLFKALGEVHPRFHTPALALVIQGAVAILLVLVGGAFRELFSLAIFAEWLFYMVAASTIFVFRRREPDVQRPYRTAGYPVVPILFVITAAVLLCYTFVSNLRDSIGGAVVILLGVPVYLWFSRKKRAAI